MAHIKNEDTQKEKGVPVAVTAASISDEGIAEAANVNVNDKVIVSVQESETLPWNCISFQNAIGEL